MDDLQRELREVRKTLPFQSDEYRSETSRIENDLELAAAEIDEIETKKGIARAQFWEVPIPPCPSSISDNDQYWYWCRVHGTFYLKSEGKAHLRRESYAEMEMRFKPWLTWLALGMSGFSLLFSLLKS